MAAGRRAWFWGGGSALVLVAAAAVSVWLGLLAGIPLFDGLAPPELYRWVQPPPELRSLNRPPPAGLASVALPVTASVNVGTPDGQVDIGLPPQSFDPAPGQALVRVSIQPLAASAVPAPPPKVIIQGNAYRMDARYVPSGATATVAQPVDLMIRYPVDATRVIGYWDGSWHLLDSIQESQQLALAARTDRLGILAAASVGVAPPQPKRIAPWAYLAAGLALLAAGVPLLLRRRSPTGG